MSGEFAAEDLCLVRPERPGGTGVLVLHGSSGRLEEGRAEVLAAHGATALAVRWFGGVGQQPAPKHVPLELFSAALDSLAVDHDHLAIVGTSFGAEAALLTAARDARVDAVVALAPTSVVWPWASHGRQASHWTAENAPLPFVPLLDDWSPVTDPPAFRDLYAVSLATTSDRVREAAAIPVERIRGSVVLVAGADDRVWPAEDFARAVAERRTVHGLSSTVITQPTAGHRTVLPGEHEIEGGLRIDRGGSLPADRKLGQRAWPAIRSALRLR